MSLIMQIVGPQGCNHLAGILNGAFTKNTADKQDMVAQHFRRLNLMEVGSGTNRLVFQIDPFYVFKVAIDNQGVEDNIKEMKLSPELEGFVTRTYETNGIIAVAEYGRTFNYHDMVANQGAVAKMLMVMAQRYLLDDVGFESFLNWCFVPLPFGATVQISGETAIVQTPDGSTIRMPAYTIVQMPDGTYWAIRCLDYAYLHSNEGVKFTCVDCYGKLGYNKTFKNLVCQDCGSQHKVSDMKKEAIRENYGVPSLLQPEFNFGFNQGFTSFTPPVSQQSDDDGGDNYNVSHFNV